MNEKKYVKPICFFASNQKMMAVLPMSKTKSSVIIRIQHEEEQAVKKLSCKVRINQLAQLDLAAPAGTVLLQAVDVLSPERCASMDYRSDGLGYSRTLTVSNVPTGLHFSIVCTLCERDEDGHICSSGDYEHTEALTLPKNQIEPFMQCLKNYLKGLELEQAAEIANKETRSYVNTKRRR